ncbi:MAG: hypothetical protein FJW30_13905 [Acidobacteria bacterium]|nr:hypothetical protein [Acidobacteriota bacterium]
MKVWLALIALTLVEVALLRVNAGPAVMLALLVGLSLVKAGMIAWWFMHLREFRPRPLVWALLFLALCVALTVIGFLQ